MYTSSSEQSISLVLNYLILKVTMIATIVFAYSVLLFNCGSFAFTGYENSNPRRSPGYCVMEHPKISFKAGSTVYTLDTCAELNCEHNGRIEINGCGINLGQCYTPGDEFKNYPQCCTVGSPRCKPRYY